MIGNSEAKNFAYKKVASVLLVIAAVTTFSYGLYQSISIANSDYESYQECGIFLERAGKAGTTGVAEKELVKAVSCLEANYSTQSFEYKDLKGNLNYLQKQPEDLVIPIVIKESIKQNTNTIKTQILNQKDNSHSVIIALVLQLIAIPLIALAIRLIIEVDLKL